MPFLGEDAKKDCMYVSSTTDVDKGIDFTECAFNAGRSHVCTTAGKIQIKFLKIRIPTTKDRNWRKI